MFSNMFAALKRIFDLTLAPILLGIAAVLVEWFLGGISFIVLAVGNVLIAILATTLAAIPFPEIQINENSFGSKFLDLASIINLWAALTFYVIGSVSNFVIRIASLGIIGR